MRLTTKERKLYETYCENIQKDDIFKGFLIAHSLNAEDVLGCGVNGEVPSSRYASPIQVEMLLALAGKDHQAWVMHAHNLRQEWAYNGIPPEKSQAVIAAMSAAMVNAVLKEPLARAAEYMKQGIPPSARKKEYSGSSELRHIPRPYDQAAIPSGHRQGIDDAETGLYYKLLEWNAILRNPIKASAYGAFADADNHQMIDALSAAQAKLRKAYCEAGLAKDNDAAKAMVLAFGKAVKDAPGACQGR